jgi:hypothetical protein
MCAQAFRGWDVNVMQEAVRQYEVDPLAGQDGQFPRVGHPKLALLASQRTANLAFIPVYAKVISMGKIARVLVLGPHSTSRTRRTRSKSLSAETGANSCSAKGAIQNR